VRTTVLVPLHASTRWTQVVAGNIERLAPHARLVVSDAAGLDDGLDRLRAQVGDLPDCEWLGPRPLAPGWVPHCNDLLSRATTEFVMWLPQDDEVDADWIQLAEKALDADPGAVLALGLLRSLEAEDRANPSTIAIAPHEPFAAPEVEDRVREALGVCIRGRVGLLGAAFRGVFRRDRGVPLPAALAPEGAWADVLWALSMLAVGSFTPTGAIYWKRWYAGNTHGRWPDLLADKDLRAQALPRALEQLPAGMRERLLAECWASEADLLRGQLDHALRLRQVSVIRRGVGRMIHRFPWLRRLREYATRWSRSATH
jgi:hypothetical protein